MAKTVKEKQLHIKNTYKDKAYLYSEGKISRKDFVRSYNNLRKLAQYRMDKMSSLGLDSTVLQNLSAFVFQDTHSQLIPSITNTSNVFKLYTLMYEFVSSPYSTESEWRAQEKIIEDIIGSTEKWQEKGRKSKKRSKYADYTSNASEKLNQKIYWINVFMQGHFWRLKKIFGSSPEAMKELDSLLDEGLTTDDIVDALDFYDASGLGFDIAVEIVKKRNQDIDDFINRFSKE